MTQSEFTAFYPQFAGFTPAIVMTTYGKGTMLVISPHPESTPALHGLMVEMIRFVARKCGGSSTDAPEQ